MGMAVIEMFEVVLTRFCDVPIFSLLARPEITGWGMMGACRIRDRGGGRFCRGLARLSIRILAETENLRHISDLGVYDRVNWRDCDNFVRVICSRFRQRLHHASDVRVEARNVVTPRLLPPTELL